MSDTTRSCSLCPSYLDKDAAGRFFGKSIGAPMCARFGKVLGGPDILPVAAEKINQATASKCASFGQAAPKAAQERLDTEVTLPHPDVLMEVSTAPSTEEDKASVNSCLNCKFYIPDSTVTTELGWGAGLCGATGRLILPGKQSREASRCEYRRYRTGGSRNLDISKMHLIPMYAEAKAYDPSPLGKWRSARASGTVVDPTEYPTDNPVSEDEAAAGIRAWRRIEDPNGTGNFTFLPIFVPDVFDPVEREKIPSTGDVEHPEDYIDAKDYVYSVAVEWMELDQTPALWGQPGVGKTELARHLAWLMQVPFDRISVTREMEVEDLIGKMMFLDGETRYQWGRLPHRWSKPGVLLLDEANAGPDAVWQRIRPLTDNSKQLVLDEAGSEIVQRDDYCFFVMAMNPAWDARNVGVAEMAGADLDRLSHVYMHLPPADVEKEILRSACVRDGWKPSEKQLKKLMEISDELRRLSDDGSLPVSWGIRPNLKVIRHIKWFDTVTSYKRAVADVLEPQVAEMVLDVVRTKGDI